MPTESATIRVALVEDDQQVREGLELLIQATPGLTCVAICSSAEEALARLPSLNPDVVLVDIHLPGRSGINCITELKRTQPSPQIMLLTVFEDHERIFQSLAAGASGYLLKQTPPEKMLEAIGALHRGASPMSTQIARRVMETFHQPDPATGVGVRLSAQEQEIIRLLAKGNLDKETADQLRLSVETVRTHLHNIYEKLHVRTRTEGVWGEIVTRDQ